MAWQLIYTSAPRGLLSGQSGFCTVARSGELREALAQRLEQISSYHYLRVAEAATANRNPAVCAFRLLDLRGSKYYVLTRIVPCGLDFTARTNHLAHHLVFQPNELAQLPDPAAILRHWSGWLSAWQGEPRLLENPALDSLAAAARPCLPAQTWLRVTGDAGRAAGILESDCVRGCYLVCPPGSEQQVLEMFSESLQLLNLNGQYALRPWRHSFTTFLQAEDNPGDFQWRACQEGAPAHQQALQRSAPLIPLRSVRVPNNSLVKVAREGLKPPAAPAAAPPAQSKLALQSLPADRRQAAPASPWHPPVKHSEKPPLLHLNFSLKFTSLARIAVFVAVLLALLATKYWLRKRQAPVQFAPPAAAVQPVQAAPAAPAERIPRYAAVPARLDFLSGPGPTYVLTASNLLSFNLPVGSISRLQNLLRRFDNLNTLPAAFRLSVNTNEWGFVSGEHLAVNGMRGHTLAAHTDSGLEFTFDYAAWLNDSSSSVSVNAGFAAPPGSFSIQFNFATPDDGDPFRLLIVNEGNAPAPLPLSKQWLKIDCESLLASLQSPLRERLSENFRLLGTRRLQLEPFVQAKVSHGAQRLYQDWPPQDVPPPGGELDFAEVKKRLAAKEQPLKDDAAGIDQHLEQQIKMARLDVPLGKHLGLAEERFASFLTFAPDPSTNRFMDYLNILGASAGKKNHPLWPPLLKDSGDADLAGRFQQIDAKWNEIAPEIMAGHTNYFSVAWQKLKEIEKTRRSLEHVLTELDKLDGRLNAVPATLGEVAYVGLFIIDPPKPSLEMIRFQGP